MDVPVLSLSPALLLHTRPYTQTDYWDSINLKNGEYAPVPLLEGVKDFLGQIGPGGAKAQQAMNAELPFELLRRSRCVRAWVGEWIVMGADGYKRRE